jgi:hypothetical protein
MLVYLQMPRKPYKSISTYIRSFFILKPIEMKEFQSKKNASSLQFFPISTPFVLWIDLEILKKREFSYTQVFIDCIKMYLLYCQCLNIQYRFSPFVT